MRKLSILVVLLLVASTVDGKSSRTKLPKVAPEVDPPKPTQTPEKEVYASEKPAHEPEKDVV
jgi:hypothetical protein